MQGPILVLNGDIFSLMLFGSAQWVMREGADQGCTIPWEVGKTGEITECRGQSYSAESCTCDLS